MDKIIKKNGNYKAINRTSANDTRLSIKAKGVMFYLLSKPDGWMGHVYDIVEHSNTGKKAVQSSLKELAEFGYVKLIKSRTENGDITSYYEIHDEPQK